MQVLSLLVIGLSLGLMVGLSVSPVVQGVVTSLVTLAAAAVGVRAGLDNMESGPASSTSEHGNQETTKKSESAHGPISRFRSGKRIHAAPMALFLVGITGGSIWGMHLRVNDVFGLDPAAVVAKWSAQSLGLDKRLIVERLFDLEYPGVAASSGGLLSQKCN